MPLNYHTSAAVCAYTQNVINDITASYIINKIFPNIFVILFITTQRTIYAIIPRDKIISKY